MVEVVVVMMVRSGGDHDGGSGGEGGGGGVTAAHLGGEKVWVGDEILLEEFGPGEHDVAAIDGLERRGYYLVMKTPGGENSA